MQTEFLHFFSAEGRSPDFRNPDGFLRHCANLSNLVRPFVYGPVIPVKREPMERDDIKFTQCAHILHADDERRINR